MIGFKEIPNEIVIMIFTYLRQEDIKNVRLVCKKWRQLSDAICLFQKSIVVIKNYPDLIASYTAQSAFCEHFKPVHMVLLIKGNDMARGFDNAEGRQFWLNQGGKLRSLIVSIAGYYFEILLEILIHCNNLEHLQVVTDGKPKAFLIKSIDLSFFEQIRFEKLSSLSVCGERHLIVPLLEHAVQTAAELEYITLICLPLKCSHMLHTPTGTIDLTQARFLKGINLQCFCIFDKFIDKMTLTVGLQLEKLVITNCQCLPDLKHIAQRCQRLKQLVIGNRTFPKRQVINAFLSLSKLTVISISKSSITDDVISSLAAVQNLTHLCIAHCNNISSNGISNIFGENVKPLITELRFFQLSITDRLIIKIAPYLPNLKILNLGKCQYITLEAIEALTTHNQSLQCLSVYDCRLISEIPAEMFYVADFLKKFVSRLRRLSNIVHMDISGVSFLSIIFTHILSSASLEVLDVMDSPVPIDVLLTRYPSLKYVNDLWCQTGEKSPDPIIRSLRLNRILDCARSPLGPCFNLRGQENTN